VGSLNPKAPHIHLPAGRNLHPFAAEQGHLQFLPRALSKRDAAIVADYAVPGEPVFFGKRMEQAGNLPRTVWKPRLNGNVAVAANPAFRDFENQPNDSARGIGHPAPLTCRLSETTYRMAASQIKAKAA